MLINFTCVVKKNVIDKNSLQHPLCVQPQPSHSSTLAVMPTGLLRNKVCPLTNHSLCNSWKRL